MTERTNNDDKSSDNVFRVERHLRRIYPDIFEGIDETQKQKIIYGFMISFNRSHVGPLPDPESLEYYNEIIPKGADRIMAMAEKQSEHRRKLEELIVISQLKQSNTGQYLAFAIGLAALATSAFCIVNGFRNFRQYHRYWWYYRVSHRFS